MNRFNLLSDPWIPVKTHQGESKQIRAFEIAQKDIKALDAPRADFNAALIQFLIGLLQTTMAPKDPREWRQLFNNPPSEKELIDKFEPIKPAFYLDGDDCRFMQDQLSKRCGEKRPIEEIVFGAPGDSGKDKNQDHFIKQNHISGLCSSCTASALMTANIFSEDGGSGYYQSMRGNGFVSNLVQLDENQSEISLWKNIWLNISENKNVGDRNLLKNFSWTNDLPDKPYLDRLEKVQSNLKELKREKKVAKSDDDKKRLAEKIKQKETEIKKVKNELYNLGDGKIIYPDKSDHQVYWAWMRRYLLETEDVATGKCSLCYSEGRLFTGFFRTGKGYKYPKEIWQNKHPFSPSKKFHRERYDKNNLKYKDKMLAVEMTTNGLPYTYWQDFLTQSENLAPAKVVINHLKKVNQDEQLIIWAFGYAMNSNSPLGWYESLTPLYLLPDEKLKKEIEGEVVKHIRAINKIADSRSGYLVAAIKNAWFDINKEKNKDKKKSFYKNKATELSKSLWQNTESKFFYLLKALHGNAQHLDDEKKEELKKGWYRHIKSETEKLFNKWAFTSSIQTNPRRISKAHNQLMQNLNSTTLKHEILGLPKEVN